MKISEFFFILANIYLATADNKFNLGIGLAYLLAAIICGAM